MAGNRENWRRAESVSDQHPNFQRNLVQTECYRLRLLLNEEIQVEVIKCVCVFFK